MVTDREAAGSYHFSMRRQTWTATGKGERTVCIHCNEDWPCLAARLLTDREVLLALADMLETRCWKCPTCAPGPGDEARKLLKEAHGE